MDHAKISSIGGVSGQSDHLRCADLHSVLAQIAVDSISKLEAFLRLLVGSAHNGKGQACDLPSGALARMVRCKRVPLGTDTLSVMMHSSITQSLDTSTSSHRMERVMRALGSIVVRWPMAPVELPASIKDHEADQ